MIYHLPLNHAFALRICMLFIVSFLNCMPFLAVISRITRCVGFGSRLDSDICVTEKFIIVLLHALKFLFQQLIFKLSWKLLHIRLVSEHRWYVAKNV
jgi:hypothetical protein